MQRPSWKRIIASTSLAWLVLAVIWYAAVFAGMDRHERDEPWQKVNPAPLLSLLAGMIISIRLLPPRDTGFTERLRRSLLATIVPTILVAIAAFAQGRAPDPPSFVEGVYQWTFALFLWAHGWPFLFLPAFYLVERPQILAR